MESPRNMRDLEMLAHLLLDTFHSGIYQKAVGVINLALFNISRKMVVDTWGNRVLSLTNSLFPLPTTVNRGNAITFCLRKTSELTDFISQMMLQRKEKSIELAGQFLKDGDDKFQSKSFKESLTSYSKSILYSSNNSPDLSLAYVKRSLALLHCCHYESAARDIEMALQSGFSRRKSLENVIHLLQMGENRRAMTAIFQVLSELNIAHSEDFMERVSEVNFEKEKYKSKWSLPKLRNGENPDFPSSSNCLQVLHNNKKGRYVIAKCDIKAGDVLFVEKAFAFTVTDSYCSGCGGNIDFPIPCQGCVDISFCSKKCKDKAWESYHKFECGFTNLIAETGVGYLALRIILNAASSFEELKKIIQNFMSKKEIEKDNPVKFSRNIYENVYNLQTHIDRMDVENLLHFSWTATLLALYLAHYTSFVVPTEENIKLLGEIILHHMTQLISNASALSLESNADNEEIPIVGFEMEKFGGAIFPSVSMMNHSCDSSIMLRVYRDMLIVTAEKDIKKGEEVFNNYGLDSRQMNRSERQMYLNSSYFFHCTCSACSQKYDPYDVLNSFKCENCKGPLLPDLAKKGGVTNVKKLFVCLKCYSRGGLREEQYRKLSEIGTLIKNGKDMLCDRDVEGALKAFVKSWMLGRTVLYKLHIDLYYSACLIAHCLYLLNDLKPSIAFLRRVVLCAERRYGRLGKIHEYQAKKLLHCIMLYCKGLEKDDVNEIKSVRELGLHYCGIVEDIRRLHNEERNPCRYIQEMREVLQRMSSDFDD